MKCETVANELMLKWSILNKYFIQNDKLKYLKVSDVHHFLVIPQIQNGWCQLDRFEIITLEWLLCNKRLQTDMFGIWLDGMHSK